MFISIEPESDVPIYLQLRNQVVKAMVTGHLVPGDALPSVRQLARDLGINLHTVNKAYQLLETQGYLHIFSRRGARLTAPPNYSDDYIQNLEQSLLHLYIDAQSQGIDAEVFQRSVSKVLNEADGKPPMDKGLEE
ncbi:MAG: GntR family transcriptional regulator [Coriobacteriia bacterium]|nr:GntR family transcriptional regulator [Coriobacteriia bacterium]